MTRTVRPMQAVPYVQCRAVPYVQCRAVPCRTFNAGPRTFNAGPRTFNAGPRTFNAGPRTFNAGPRTFNAGPRTFNVGSRTFKAGPYVVQSRAVHCSAVCRLLFLLSFSITVSHHGKAWVGPSTGGMGPDYPWASTSSSALAKSGSMASGWAQFVKRQTEACFRDDPLREAGTFDQESRDCARGSEEEGDRDRGSSRRPRGAVLEGISPEGEASFPKATDRRPSFSDGGFRGEGQKTSCGT